MESERTSSDRAVNQPSNQVEHTAQALETKFAKQGLPRVIVSGTVARIAAVSRSLGYTPKIGRWAFKGRRERRREDAIKRRAKRRARRHAKKEKARGDC